MVYGEKTGHRPDDRRRRSEGIISVRSVARPPAGEDGSEEVRGIGVFGATPGGSAPKPRIAAFIWAEREDTPPTLPYGRWKVAS